MSIDPEVKRALDMRLATGEISQEEYTKTLESLNEASQNAPAPAPSPVPNQQPRPRQPRPAPGRPPQVTQNVNNTQQVNVNIPQSPVFAVITLICWFILPPIGFILNLIGLFTGPCRGCFLSMFLIALIPTVVLIILITAGVLAIPSF